MFFTLSFVISVSLRCHAFLWGSPPSVAQCALPGSPCTFGICATGAAIQIAAQATATIDHTESRCFTINSLGRGPYRHLDRRRILREFYAGSHRDSRSFRRGGPVLQI